MDNEKIKSELKRLIDEATAIAPSIARFEDDRSYGKVTDEGLDVSKVMRWELESKALLQELSASKSPIFVDLLGEYLQMKEKSKGYHSKSILVHRVQQILISALQLLDSPLVTVPRPEPLSTQATLDTEAGYAFIAMPMDPNDHALVDILEAVKETAARCSIHAERVDESLSSERITDQILDSIRRAEYIIVDLTNSRANVYFEAGFAHGLGKTPIYFAEQGTKLEFDLKDYPVLFFRNLKELRDLLEKRLRGLSASAGV